MTHEYVIGLGGIVAPYAGDAVPGEPATAIAWAADRILAIGSDADVRSISRGDSIFLDLAGCVVTPLPGDPARAEGLLRDGGSRMDGADRLERVLVDAGLLAPDAGLEPGSPADLAFWAGDPVIRLRATVIGGAFTAGDEHLGPFARIRTSPDAIDGR